MFTGLSFKPNSWDAETVLCYHSIGSNIKMKSLLYNSQEAFLDITQLSHSKIVLGQLNIRMFTRKCTEIQANRNTEKCPVNSTTSRNCYCVVAVKACILICTFLSTMRSHQAILWSHGRYLGKDPSQGWGNQGHQRRRRGLENVNRGRMRMWNSWLLHFILQRSYFTGFNVMSRYKCFIHKPTVFESLCSQTAASYPHGTGSLKCFWASASKLTLHTVHFS